MNIKSFLILFCLSYQVVIAQTKDNYKNVYALKGGDTIGCKILYDKNHPRIWDKVTLLIHNGETIFQAGGPITEFGITEEGVVAHYGFVRTKTRSYSHHKNLFVKKITVGVLELYEHHYNIYKTMRGTSNSTFESFTDYYIAKKDSAAPMLATPVLFSSFRKKDLEPYLKDNTDLLAPAEKRFSLKELIALINEYNNWYLKKEKVTVR